MALTRSLSAGASSLRAHQQRFDVISNNIANSNTLGFKSSRVLFAEQLKQTYSIGKPPEMVAGRGSGGVNPMQFGLGVKVGAVTANMTQGVIEQTGRPLDLALQGDGFFVYNLNGRNYYSRAGAITRDEAGNLVDSMTGAKLQGHMLQLNEGKMVKDTDGINTLNPAIQSLNIDSSLVSPPRQTANMKIAGNLNSAGTTNTRQTSMTIHDQRGNSHTLSLTFTRNDADPNTYDITAQIDGSDVTLTDASVTFKADGTIDTPTDLTISTTELNTALANATPPQTNTPFDTTSDLNIQMADPDNLLSGLTHFSGPNTATLTEQDGYQEGTLADVSVDSDGRIYGAFSNGQSEILGQVVIAKFSNPGGLVRDQGNYYSVSPNSGDPIIGTAAEEFPSTTIAAYSLEQSNVDMTEQFTEMISTQRAYEASSRTITVSDQMLAETNMLKR